MQRIAAVLNALIIATIALSGCRSEKSGSGQTVGDGVSKPVLAIAHATVIDATGAPAAADQTVLIAGNLITAVGPAGEVRIPAGATVVDGRGKYLVPGLWDMHTHLHFGTPEVLPVFVGHGVTGIRELSTDLREIWRIRELGRAGRLVQPRIAAAGSMIEAIEVKAQLERFSPPGLLAYFMTDRIFIRSPEEARAVVREVAALKPDLIKHHASNKRDIYFAVLDEAHRLGLPVAGHFPGGEKISLREAADAGQSTIEHLGWPHVAADFAALDPAGKRELMEHVRNRHLAFVPTLVAGRVAGKDSSRAGPNGEDTAAERLKRAHLDPRARYVAPSLWEDWEGMIALIDAANKAVDVPAFDPKPELALLSELNKAGGAILPGTDFTVQFLFPASSLHEELQEMARQIGMTPHEVLQAATRRSAEQLGLQDRVGTVQLGKEADLVLLDADPLADIANTQRINAVVLQGQLFDRRGLDELLDGAAVKLRTARPSAPQPRSQR